VVAQTTSSTIALSSRQVDSGGGRNRDHGAPGPQLAEGLDGGAHAGARGEAVVDHDDGLARDLGRGTALPVGLLPPEQLAALPLGHLLDDLGPDAEPADDVLVADQRPAAGDHPHGHLLVAGDAELADQVDVEGAPRAMATS
jgi:hypothetical protein